MKKFRTLPAVKNSSNKKTKNAWAFYDWANSVYPLVISSTFFPMFYESVTKEKGKTVIDSDGDVINYVSFFGHDFVNTEIYSYVIAASLLAVVVLSPVLSGIADNKGSKKLFLKFFCYLGAFATATLYFFNVDKIEWGMLSLFFASLGYWDSIVFYNSFLPKVAPPEEHDKLSAKGYSLGYAGSVLLLVILLFVIVLPEDSSISFMWCFPIVGLWWMLFSQYTFRNLPEEKAIHSKPTKSLLKSGFKEIKKVFLEILKTYRLKRYLLAFFVFSMAIQTIMMMAQFFGMKEIERVNDAGEIVIGLSTDQLIISILALQVVAIPGAFFFSWLAKKLSNKIALIVVLLIWILVCVYAYAVVHSPNEFYITAGLIGFIMGGSQSLSRSTYSKYLPETEDHASYFSFYDVLEKIGIVIGMVSFGFIEGVTGSMRASVLSLVAFFAVGIFLMFLVPKNEKRKIDRVGV